MQQGTLFTSPGQSPGEAVPHSQLPLFDLTLTFHLRELLGFS